MVDGCFTRWPGTERPILSGHGERAKLLHSLEGPEEFVCFEPEFASGSPIEGYPMRYLLEQVSDSGPSAEPFGALMLVAFDVPPHRQAAVDRWYDEEHIDLLMRAPGWLRARRYRVKDFSGGPRWTSMAFHELRDIAVLQSPERAFARSTPWRAELTKEPWFAAAGRGVFGPIC